MVNFKPFKKNTAMNNEFEKEKKFNFLDEVDYSTGGVVSKNVIKKPTGNISLFAFEKGEGLSEHTAPFDALLQVIDGEAKVTINGKPHELKAGESIIMPANSPHAVWATERFKMVLTMIKD
jgi:quercetin dioxygenase-like cupin family protein